MSIVTTSNEPVIHLKRLYRVRVRHAGVAAYSYNVRARNSMDVWEEAFDRATERLKDGDMPPRITVIRLRNVKPIQA